MGPDRSEEHEHVRPRVPRSRRTLVLSLLIVAGVVVAVGGLLANWLTATPVRWPALVVVVGSTVVVFALYLWIRLAK